MSLTSVSDEQRAHFLLAVRTGAVDEALAQARARPALAEGRTPDGVSVVMWACYAGHVELACKLAEMRPSPLDVFEAAALDETGRMAELLAGGGDPASARTIDGFAPLHLAAFFGAAGTAAQLLDAGADADAVADNAMRVRPLHSAAAGRHPDVIALLLAAGADVSSDQRSGFTALHSAAANGDEESTRLLLAAGADPERRNDDQLTPAALARAAGHTAVVKMLRRSVTAS